MTRYLKMARIHRRLEEKRPKTGFPKWQHLRKRSTPFAILHKILQQKIHKDAAASKEGIGNRSERYLVGQIPRRGPECPRHHDLLVFPSPAREPLPTPLPAPPN